MREGTEKLNRCQSLEVLVSSANSEINKNSIFSLEVIEKKEESLSLVLYRFEKILTRVLPFFPYHPNFQEKRSITIFSTRKLGGN